MTPMGMRRALARIAKLKAVAPDHEPIRTLRGTGYAAATLQNIPTSLLRTNSRRSTCTQRSITM